MMTMSKAKEQAVKAGFRLFTIGTRGATKDVVMVPHRHSRGPFAGMFVASPTRYFEDYVGVRTEDELIPWLRRGYGVRMAPIGCSSPANLFGATTIHGWR